MTNTINFRLEIARADLREERTAVEVEDSCQLGEEKPISHPGGKGIATAHFVDPVTLVGVVTLAWLAERMVDHWLRSKEQGVQIDLREEPPAMSRIAGVPVGFLVIINRDGHAETHKATYDKPEALMPLLEGILATA